MSPMHPDTVVERPAKRKKVSVACEPCRTRKVKCDGSRPTCKPCQDRHIEEGCVYTGHDASYDDSRERYIEQLEARVRKLENRSGEGSLTDDGSSVPNGGQAHTTYGPRQASMDNAQVSAPHNHHSTDKQRRGTDASLQSSQARSSAVPVHSLLEKTASLEQPSMQSVGSSALRRSSTQNVSQLQIVVPSKEGQDAVPSSPVAIPERELFEVYVHYLHWMYPSLHLPTLRQRYEAVSAGKDPGCDEALFQALLNAMFAAAVQVLHGQSSSELSEMYYARTKALLTLDVLSAWSLELVQTLLVCVQYLQSADQPQQCWIVITTAIRVAQGLGLHLPSSSSNVTDAEEQDTLRRTWYCCTTLDRVIAMSLVRPPLLTAEGTNTIPFPKLRAPYEAFVVSLNLFRRHHDVINQFYYAHKAESNTLPSFTFDELLAHEQAYADWEDEMPLKLRFPFDTEPDRPEQELLISSFLRERYLQIRIILYRPALSAILHQGEQKRSCFSSQTVKFASLLAASKTCFEAAQAMLTTIFDRVQAGSAGRPCSIWWFDIYFGYTAATVILAAKFTPAVSAILNPSEVELAVQQYTHIFSHHSQHHRAAARCLAVLTRIAGSVGLPPDSTNPASSISADAGMTDANPAFNASTSLVSKTQQSSAQPSNRSSVAPVDTLDYATWLATVPLDFNRSEWDEWLASYGAEDGLVGTVTA